MIWIIGVLLFVISLLFVIFLFALVWQNEDGASGMGWLLNKMGVMLTAKNIIIAILVFLLIVVVRLFQLEIGANKNLLGEIDRYEQFSKDKTQKLNQLQIKIDNFLKEHKRARKYFE